MRFVIGRACCCIQAASVLHIHDKPSFRETVLMSCLYTGFISLYTGIILQICKAYNRRRPVILPPKTEIQPKQSVYYSVNRRQYTDTSAYWQENWYGSILTRNNTGKNTQYWQNTLPYLTQFEDTGNRFVLHTANFSILAPCQYVPVWLPILHFRFH